MKPLWIERTDPRSALASAREALHRDLVTSIKADHLENPNKVLEYIYNSDFQLQSSFVVVICGSSGERGCDTAQNIRSDLGSALQEEIFYKNRIMR
uniref:Uncharacterized protein n=2 Tax=Nothobranchius korthausae TaxID=1143690 RepID=A0A1A8G535_9TELE